MWRWATVKDTVMKIPITVTILPSVSRTRLLVTQQPDELLRAILPPLTMVKHPRAVLTLLEGLSLWLNRKLRVVLSADALETSFSLGLTDSLYDGADNHFFEVEVVTRARGRRGRRIRGVGDFAELRQLELHAGRNGRGIR